MLRSIIAIAASFLYIAAVILLITRSVKHYELLVVALQFILLLPALSSCLRISDPQGGFVWAPSRAGLWALAACFVLGSFIFSYHIGQGIVFADESSYEFQARAFASLKTVGNAPPITAIPSHASPEPLAFKHIVLSPSGRFTKYPIAWPAVLALGERFGAGWAVTPLLGGLLIILVGLLTHEAFGAMAVLPSVWIAVLSPYCLSYCTGKMSHALCAVLIASACLFCLRGIRTSKMSQFGFMFAALVISFHVRPFTAFITSTVLSLAILYHYRRNRPMLARFAAMAAVSGFIAVTSVMAYNHFYTGRYLLSPYALYDGKEIPTDITTTPAVVLSNILMTRRYSVQTTLLYSFPFVFLLAAYGFWVKRQSQAACILALLFPAIFLAHFAQTFSSSPIVGERYYFEAYIAVVVLAGYGTQALLLRLRTQRKYAILVAVLLTIVQGAMTVVGARQISLVGKPYREVTKVAETYRNCRCAIFLKSSTDKELSYFSPNLNFDGPAWKPGDSDYLNDPGPAERGAWANAFGWHDWAVVTYDPQTQTARSETYHLYEAPSVGTAGYGKRN